MCRVGLLTLSGYSLGGERPDDNGHRLAETTGGSVGLTHLTHAIFRSS